MMSQFEQFGKYILLEKLASGGMAEVYLAKSTGATGVNKFLAIKRILPQFSENQEFIEMFREEAKICVNLNNSNVVSIFDFGVELQQFYLVMEYVEGRNLRQIINELKKQQIQLQIEQICYIIKEAAAGLDHAHRCIDGSTGRPLNIIHRDISPQNVMISFDGEVKIIDFGIAKAETQLEATKAGTLKGKFGYMSPEQADGQTIDLRTDIFSLGIVLWELLANDRLFTASSEAAILRKIRECQIPSIRKINPNVPPELEKIVNKALAKDKNLRYQTSAALHKDLNRFLNIQFPDFNPQDFAVFVKNAFAQSYQDSRRKLVDFAKIQATDEKVSVGGIGSPPPPPKRGESTVIDHAFPSEDSLNIDPDTNVKVDLKELQKLNGQPPGELTRSKVIMPPGFGHTQTRTGVTPTGTRTGIQQPLPAHFGGNSLVDDLINWGVKLGVVAIVAIGGWWVWSNGMLKGSKAPAAPVAEVETDSGNRPSGTSVSASKAQYQVSIKSDPPGARIHFDGQNMNIYAPKIVTMEGNRTVHLTLYKDGYYPYEIDFTPVKDAQTLNALLQPLGRAAYVSVNVHNGGADPVVEINGRRIGQKPPVDVYPIPAGVPVQIRARNSFGAMAETTLTLEPEQKKTLDLILGAPP